MGKYDDLQIIIGHVTQNYEHSQNKRTPAREYSRAGEPQNDASPHQERAAYLNPGI
jgi:hypothetical protein